MHNDLRIGLGHVLFILPKSDCLVFTKEGDDADPRRNLVENIFQGGEVAFLLDVISGEISGAITLQSPTEALLFRAYFKDKVLAIVDEFAKNEFVPELAAAEGKSERKFWSVLLIKALEKRFGYDIVCANYIKLDNINWNVMQEIFSRNNVEQFGIEMKQVADELKKNVKIELAKQRELVQKNVKTSAHLALWLEMTQRKMTQVFSEKSEFIFMNLMDLASDLSEVFRQETVKALGHSDVELKKSAPKFSNKFYKT